MMYVIMVMTHLLTLKELLLLLMETFSDSALPLPGIVIKSTVLVLTISEGPEGFI
jgi:hypothetical protein